MNTPHYPSFMSYLAVLDGAKAIEFYQTAFGATELCRLTDPNSGKIGHAELEIGGVIFMLSDEFVGFTKAPPTLGGTPVKFCLMVENADTAFDRAVAAGAEIVQPVTDQFYGFRSGSLRDPFGHEWMIQHQTEALSHEELEKRWNNMMAGDGLT